MPKSTTTTSSHGRATALLLSSTLPLICCGFVQVSTLNAILPRSHSVHVNPSPLFVVQSDIDVNGDPTAYPVIKSIDAKMEKFKKRADKYQQKLDKFEMGLEVLKSKKMRYLEGIELGQPPKGSNFGETMRRSAVKAMMWRVIAGTVTLITSLKFSGSLATALRIVGSDFFSKAITMFVGERVMNKSQAGRKTGADSAGRSVAKALIWRIFAITNTLTVSFFFAKDLKMASKIAGSDAIFKTALMVLYERVWSKVEWGKYYDDFII